MSLWGTKHEVCFFPCLVPHSHTISPLFFFFFPLFLFLLLILYRILLLSFLHPPTPRDFLAFAQGFMRNLENLARPRSLLGLRMSGVSGAVGASLVIGAESAVGSVSVLLADTVALLWLSQSKSHCRLLRSSFDFSALSSLVCWNVVGVAFSNFRSNLSRRFISSQRSRCLLVSPSRCRAGSRGKHMKHCSGEMAILNEAMYSGNWANAKTRKYCNCPPLPTTRMSRLCRRHLKLKPCGMGRHRECLHCQLTNLGWRSGLAILTNQSKCGSFCCC